MTWNEQQTYYLVSARLSFSVLSSQTVQLKKFIRSEQTKDFPKDLESNVVNFNQNFFTDANKCLVLVKIRWMWINSPRFGQHLLIWLWEIYFQDKLYFPIWAALLMKHQSWNKVSHLSEIMIASFRQWTVIKFWTLLLAFELIFSDQHLQ